MIVGVGEVGITGNNGAGTKLVGSEATICVVFSTGFGFEVRSRSNPTPAENVSSATITRRIKGFTERPS
jgi:hypothetical protein